MLLVPVRLVQLMLNDRVLPGVLASRWRFILLLPSLLPLESFWCCAFAQETVGLRRITLHQRPGIDVKYLLYLTSVDSNKLGAVDQYTLRVSGIHLLHV